MVFIFSGYESSTRRMSSSDPQMTMLPACKDAGALETRLVVKNKRITRTTERKGKIHESSISEIFFCFSENRTCNKGCRNTCYFPKNISISNSPFPGKYSQKHFDFLFPGKYPQKYSQKYSQKYFDFPVATIVMAEDCIGFRKML